MENEGATTLYVVTAESQDRKKDDYSNVINVEHDVMRIFRSKEDMRAYIYRYYEKTQSKVCTIKTTESKSGYLKIKLTEYFDCPDNGHSFEGHLDGREHKVVIKGFPLDLDETGTTNGADLENDIEEIYNG